MTITDHQRARAVHALDPVELDVAGGRRPADEGQRAGRLEPGQHLGHGVHDLVGAHHADVRSGTRRDRAAALVGRAVERDRAGLRAGRRAGGDHGVEPVEVGGRRAAVVVAPVAGAQPSGRPGARATRPAVRRRAPPSASATVARRSAPAHAHGGLVVDQPVLEQVDSAGATRRSARRPCGSRGRSARARSAPALRRGSGARMSSRRSRHRRPGSAPTSRGRSPSAARERPGCGPARQRRRQRRGCGRAAAEQPAERGRRARPRRTARVDHRPGRRGHRHRLGGRDARCGPPRLDVPARAGGPAATGCRCAPGRRRSTRRTGVDAYGRDALSSTPVSCGESTAPIGPG